MMQNQIIIYLQPHNISWIILSNAGRIIESVQRGDLHQLASLANQNDIVVVVPGNDVLLTSTTLPKLSPVRIRQALPFALEEHLIEDVNLLHFAIADYQPDGTIPAAVVHQEKMQEWLTLFKEAGLTPRAFIPAMLALPYSEKTWQVNSYEAVSLVRTGKYSGFACETANVDMLLNLKLTEEKMQTPPTIIRTSWSEKEWLEKMGHSLLQTPFINLLQGPYQPKFALGEVKKTWLASLFLLIACIGVVLFSDVISLWMLNKKNASIESEIRKIYFQQFPQATSMVAPRERMTEKLKKLSSTANKNPFLLMTAIVSKNLRKHKTIRVQSLDFREQQLNLEISAASFEALDQFSRALTQDGLQVKQQNSAIFSGQVKASLLIRTGAA